MFKIYVQNKPLFLTDKISDEIKAYLHRPQTVFMDELSFANLDYILQQMENDSTHAGVFQHSGTNELLQAFKAHLTVFQAAGGLVYTPDRELLLIFRRGKWDLPKGKLDEGEDLEACALRELEEETGLSTATMVQPISVTYHTYHERGKHILKESHWYLMRSEKAEPLTPQTEEDIEKCEWVSLKNLPLYTTNMHASIIDVVTEGTKRINGRA